MSLPAHLVRMHMNCFQRLLIILGFMGRGNMVLVLKNMAAGVEGASPV